MYIIIINYPDKLSSILLSHSVCTIYILSNMLLSKLHYMILDQIKLFKSWSTLLICGFLSAAMRRLDWEFVWRGWGLGSEIRGACGEDLVEVEGPLETPSVGACLWSRESGVDYVCGRALLQLSTPRQPPVVLLCQSFELNYWSFNG